jgi:hypothetical protein
VPGPILHPAGLPLDDFTFYLLFLAALAGVTHKLFNYPQLDLNIFHKEVFTFAKSDIFLKSPFFISKSICIP